MPVVRSYTLAVCFGIFSSQVPVVVGAKQDLGGLSGIKPLPVGHGPMPVQLGKYHTQLFPVLLLENRDLHYSVTTVQLSGADGAPCDPS